MENVKGMYPYADQVKQDFEKISYAMTYDVLVSDQFGVAQKRPRLFFIGIRKDIIKKKKINISDVFAEIKEETKKLKKHIMIFFGPAPWACPLCMPLLIRFGMHCCAAALRCGSA